MNGSPRGFLRFKTDGLPFTTRYEDILIGPFDPNP